MGAGDSLPLRTKNILIECRHGFPEDDLSFNSRFLDPSPGMPVWGSIIAGWALGDYHLVDDGVTIYIRLQLGDVGDVLLWLLMLGGLTSDK